MDVCRAWADEMVHNREWFDRMGVAYRAGDRLSGGDFRNLPGGSDGKPIKHLYEAGSLGHTCGQVYAISGANYCGVFVWGRISGRNAAAEKPWT